MPAATAHTYLKTRASLMAKQLFDQQQLNELLESSLDSLQQRFDLTELTKDRDDRSALNRAAERALIGTLLYELAVLLRPLDGASRDILIHWTRKFELFNLKALIRGKGQNLSADQIKHNLFPLPALISLPHDRLLEAEGILELLRLLEQGPYADIARQARQVYEEHNEPFSLDAAIDHSYYTSLLRRIRRAAPEEGRSLSTLMGTLIDHQNLIWLLRYRFNYGLAPSETYYLLVPFGRRLHRERLKALVELDGLEQVLAALPGRLAQAMRGINNLVDAEQALEQETIDQARHCLRYSRSAVTRSLAYLALREIDLKKLYAILQGKVLNLDPDLIRKAARVPVPG